MNINKLKNMLDGKEDIDQDMVNKILETEDNANKIADDFKKKFDHNSTGKNDEVYFNEIEKDYSEKMEINEDDFEKPSEEEVNQINEDYKKEIDKIKREDAVNKAIAQLSNLELAFNKAKESFNDAKEQFSELVDSLSEYEDERIKEKLQEINNKHFTEKEVKKASKK